jgi:hypothetical protein
MAQIDGQEEYRNLAAAVFMTARKDYHELKGKLGRLNERSWVTRWIEINTPRIQRQAKGEWRKDRGYDSRYTPKGAVFVPVRASTIKAMAHQAYRMKVKQYEDEITVIEDLFSGPSRWSDLLGIDFNKFGGLNLQHGEYDTRSCPA